jgi:Family of unknown function (DUF6152)
MNRMSALALALLIVRASVSAHHSFAAEYDGDKPVTVSGTVVRIDWNNPHIHFYVDVKDDSGTLTQWKFEGYPPNMLVRQGWKKDETLKPGDRVTVFGWRSRLETNGAASRLVTFTDGRKMQSGPPAGTGGQ